MRIAHIIWALGMGGAETMLIDLSNAQSETESVAVVIVNNKVEESLLRKISPHCLVKRIERKEGSRSLLPWVRLNLFLFRFRPDVIHFHLEGMRKMVLHPAPKVFTIHNIHTSTREYHLYDALYAISDGVRHYTQKQGYESITVWNGIQTREIKKHAGDSFIPGGFCSMVCVGRLYTPHKGQDILINALELIKAKGFSNFHLDIIGEGESRAQLEELVSNKGLDEQVSFLGQQDRAFIYSHLGNYNLFVLPSRSEGFGLSVAEAMCARVPVIVCDIEGALNVIDGGRLGNYFRSGDPQSLAMQILAFIKNGVDQSLIEEARQFAIEHFDISQTANHYLEEYKKLLS